MKRTSETVYLQSLVQESYESAETIKEKVQIKKKSKIIPGRSCKISTFCESPLPAYEPIIASSLSLSHDDAGIESLRLDCTE